MKISALLNPEMERRRSSKAHRHNKKSTSQATSSRPSSSAMPSKKGQSRERKDAAKFDLAEPTGEIIYPPYQPTSEDFKAQLKRYNVYPEPDQIHRYPRHIPYSSDKKRFFAKTGRESFEAFQYKFHYTEPPADDGRRSHAGEKEWPVLWDYNTGLVRITPFFKCQNYGKTIPAKVISQNSGLMDLCHSITGGALVAQGYWMPFEAAKALAMTFCYNIRFALVPLFGPDFVTSCIEPGDPAYKRFIIDPKLIKFCAQQHKQWIQRQSGGLPTLREAPRLSLSPSPGPVDTSIAEHVMLRRTSRVPRVQYTDDGFSSDTSMISNYIPVVHAKQEEDDSFPSMIPTSSPAPFRAETVYTAVDHRWFLANSSHRKKHRKIVQPHVESDVEIVSEISRSAPPSRGQDEMRFSSEEVRAAEQLLALRYG